MVAIQRANWKEEAIERSEAITDAWEVTKIYAGRVAEWVLFVCMVMNIIEILPGVHFWTWLVNTILGIQAVTLDIAGFGLATMAKQAFLSGEREAAVRAKRTAILLITIMMITVLSLSIGTLWPTLRDVTDFADKLLILIRVGMTVWYGHVLHDLRQHTGKVLPASIIEERLSLLTERVSQLQPKEVHYRQLAQQIVPLLPQPERVDIEGMMASVLTEMSHLQAHKEQAVSEALSALQATVTEMIRAQVPLKPEGNGTVMVPEDGMPGTDTRPMLVMVPPQRGTSDEIASFIGTFMEREGRVPTLSEIMDATGCTKSTASRNRSKVLKEQTA